MIKVIKWHADERVDLPDANKFAGEIVLDENLRMLREMFMPEGRNTGYAATEGRVFHGFDIPTALPAATVTLNRGTGIFKLLRNGELALGMLLGDAGQASQVIDLAGNGADTYDIYIRAAYTDTDKENRVHWDDAGTQEIVLFVDTREELIWEWTYRAHGAAVPAGGDWMLVWELDWDGAQVTSRADRRHLYFEGDNAGAIPPLPSEWGTGNDRNVNRGDYGVRDFHQWVQAMRQKIDDIQGAYYNWFAAPSITLSDLDNEHWGSAQFGKHKQVTFGDAGQWWKLSETSATVAKLEALDASNGGIVWQLDDVTAPGNRYFNEFVAPYGLGVDLIVGDKFVRSFGTNWRDEFEKVTATKMIRRFTALVGGSNEAQFKMGIGYSSTERGLTIGDDAGYHLSSRTAYMLVNPTSMRQDAASGWDFTAGAIDVSANALYWTTALAGDDMYFIVHDFPDWATLTAVRVYWRQGGDGVTRQMQMHVARCTHDLTITGKYAAAVEILSSLNSAAGGQFIEFGGAAVGAAPPGAFDVGNPWRVDEFPCDQNNTNFRQRDDEIHIGIFSGAQAVGYYVYAILLIFDYTEPGAFPQ